MLKLRDLNNAGASKETLTLNAWLDRQTKNGKSVDGRYIVNIIMAPAKYPSATIVFDAGDVRVKLSLTKESWDVFKEAYEIKPNDISGKEFYVIIQNNEVNVDAVDYVNDKQEAVYSFDKVKRYWKLTYVDTNVTI